MKKSFLTHLAATRPLVSYHIVDLNGVQGNLIMSEPSKHSHCSVIPRKNRSMETTSSLHRSLLNPSLLLVIVKLHIRQKGFDVVSSNYQDTFGSSYRHKVCTAVLHGFNRLPLYFRPIESFGLISGIV